MTDREHGCLEMYCYISGAYGILAHLNHQPRTEICDTIICTPICIAICVFSDGDRYRASSDRSRWL